MLDRLNRRYTIGHPGWDTSQQAFAQRFGMQNLACKWSEYDLYK